MTGTTRRLLLATALLGSVGFVACSDDGGNGDGAGGSSSGGSSSTAGNTSANGTSPSTGGRTSSSGGASGTSTAGSTSGGTSSSSTSTTSGGATTASTDNGCTAMTGSLITNFDNYDGTSAINGWKFNLNGGTENAGTWMAPDGTGTATTTEMNNGAYAYSGYSMHIAIDTATSWGVSMNVWMDCVNATDYDGISFWAQGDSPSNNVLVTLGTKATTTTARGGTCAGVENETCKHASASVPLPSTWGLVQIPWSAFTGGLADGATVIMNGAGINNVVFNNNLAWDNSTGAAAPAAVDMGVDEVGFYPTSGSGGSGGTGGTGGTSSTDTGTGGSGGTGTTDTGTGGTGGTDTTDTSAGGSGGTSTTDTVAACPALTTGAITDFETYDGLTALASWQFTFNGGSNSGGTYVSNDGTGTITEEMDTTNQYAGSYSLRSYNVTSSAWGNGFGMWLNCFDASSYTGIQFYARGSGSGVLKFGTVETDCSTDCSGPYYNFTLTDAWTVIQVPFTAITAGEVNNVTTAPTWTDINQLVFNSELVWADNGSGTWVVVPAETEIEVDNITFY